MKPIKLKPGSKARDKVIEVLSLKGFESVSLAPNHTSAYLVISEENMYIHFWDISNSISSKEESYQEIYKLSKQESC